MADTDGRLYLLRHPFDLDWYKHILEECNDDDYQTQKKMYLKHVDIEVETERRRLYATVDQWLKGDKKMIKDILSRFEKENRNG